MACCNGRHRRSHMPRATAAKPIACPTVRTPALIATDPIALGWQARLLSQLPFATTCRLIARPVSIDSDLPAGISQGTSSTPAWASGAVRGQVENDLSQFGFASFGPAILRHSGPRRVKSLLEDDQGLRINAMAVSPQLYFRLIAGNCRSTSRHSSKD